MKTTQTNIPDILIIEPNIFRDKRGFFFESFNQTKFEEAIGRTVKFVQDNHSKSTKGVARGLHYQLPPHAQGKLVRVIEGEVFDVAVDIRKNSPTFGKWTGIILSADNKKQFWIPEGFAHGFITLSDTAELLYKTTNYYAPESDRGIKWDDPAINIEWPYDGKPLLSEKDSNTPSLLSAELFI